MTCNPLFEKYSDKINLCISQVSFPIGIFFFHEIYKSFSEYGNREPQGVPLTILSRHQSWISANFILKLSYLFHEVRSTPAWSSSPM